MYILVYSYVRLSGIQTLQFVELHTKKKKYHVFQHRFPITFSEGLRRANKAHVSTDITICFHATTLHDVFGAPGSPRFTIRQPYDKQNKPERHRIFSTRRLSCCRFPRHRTLRQKRTMARTSCRTIRNTRSMIDCSVHLSLPVREG